MTRNSFLHSRKMRGGLASGGAGEYGSAIFPGGAMGQLNANVAGNLSASANQIVAANPAQVWSSCGGTNKKKGGSRKNGKMGGTLLVDIAVPAALVYSNQMYSRKNRNNKSRKMRKSSRRHRRK